MWKALFGADPLVPCVRDGTALLTVATSSAYLDNALLLAQSARAHAHFPCVHLAAPARLLPLESAHAALLTPVILPRWAADWLAEAQFCTRHMSGWRQTHILKTQALLQLLERGLHVVLLDADRRFVGDPMPALESIGVDVAGLRDEALLNFGLLYIRASASTRALAYRVANRSTVAWDQAVFSEEIGANRSLTCCYTNHWVRQCVKLEQHTHDLNKLDAVAVETQAAQAASECRGSADRPAYGAALRPPIGSGRMFQTWHSSRYNELPLAHRKYSRCTRTPCLVRLEGVVGARTDASSIGEGGGFDSGVASSSSAKSTGPPTVCVEAGSNVSAHLSPPPHDGPTAVVTADAAASRLELRCTVWPPGSDGMPDRQRCAHGDTLRDGYRYVFNQGRGTRNAACGAGAACTCCRYPLAGHAREVIDV